MSSEIVFNVEVRERTGKGGARAARRQGRVPGVLYGGDQPPVPISLKFSEVIRAINTGQFSSSTATLVHEGKKQLVLPQDIQLHPVTEAPMHVDLYRQTVTVEIPVHFLNEETSPGLKRGGTLNVVRHTIEVNVPAGTIPDYFEADIGELEIGDNVKISDITLPDDCEPTITDRDFTIATIAGRTATEDPEAGEEEVDPDDVESTEQGDDEAE